jgi:UDP-3-O-[3-hydroxymyristoyl] glucosamine N-acyltransferase
MGATKIKKGTKLDNLVQIGHNVSVGEYTVIASMAGISGSTVIGNGVKIGGQSGFSGHIRVGNGALIAGQAGVTKDVPEGIMVSGYPAKEHMKAIKEEIHIRNLPSLVKKVKEQEKRIDALEKLIKKQ